MSNNSCDGSVWNVLTRKLELWPEEAFTSKTLGFVSSCGGFSHTHSEPFRLVTHQIMKANEEFQSLFGANHQQLEKHLNFPKISDGIRGPGIVHSKVVDWNPVYKLDLIFWSYQEIQIGMKQGNVICVTVNICITQLRMSVCMGVQQSTSNSL